ncbi:extensin family protein, partial [Klebsiella pneumoniae]|nr:extensin family protein [Klebsiella pneumoniae]
GQAVTQINSMGSYSCRGMNGAWGAPLSEHAFGNAIDIGGFVLADGREIAIVRDWTRGDEQTRAFLMDVHGGSCRHF